MSTLRLVVAGALLLVLAVPVFVLEMGGHLFGWTPLIGQQTSNWVQMILATPVVLWAGWPFFQRGWRRFQQKG